MTTMKEERYELIPAQPHAAQGCPNAGRPRADPGRRQNRPQPAEHPQPVHQCAGQAHHRALHGGLLGASLRG